MDVDHDTQLGEAIVFVLIVGFVHRRFVEMAVTAYQFIEQLDVEDSARDDLASFSLIRTRIEVWIDSMPDLKPVLDEISARIAEGLVVEFAEETLRCLTLMEIHIDNGIRIYDDLQNLLERFEFN